MKAIIPWPVVLSVVLLDLLDVMVRLRKVHSLCVFPGKVPDEAQRRKDDDHAPEGGTAEQLGNDAVKFHAEAEFRRHYAVDWKEDEPDDQTSRYCDHCVLGPDVGDQSSFAQGSDETSCIQGCTPYPVACYLAVG